MNIIGKTLIGKIIKLNGELTFVGNIEEESGGSVSLMVNCTFAYEDKRVIVLSDLRGIGYMFYYTEKNDLLTLNSIQGCELENIMEYMFRMLNDNQDEMIGN